MHLRNERLNFACRWTITLVIGLLGAISAARAAESTRALEDMLRPAIEHHRGDVAVAVKHLESGETFVHQGSRPMPTASLIKLPVMISTYRAVERGEVSLDDMLTLAPEDLVPGSGVLTTHFSPGAQLSLRDAVRLMIAVSDNSATNLVIERIGIATTNDCMDDLGCDETKLHSKVFRRDTSIAPQRSEQFGLGSTTCDEMLRLLDRLHHRDLVSEQASEAMLEHLAACEDSMKVPRLLPDAVSVAHKVGSVSSARCDAGIMDTPGGPIAFCILTNNNEDRRWTSDNEGDLFCAEIGAAIYRYFNADGEGVPAPVARVLGIGDDGRLVESLQRTINARTKPSLEIGVDGDFGPETESAVKEFQIQADLPATGIVDTPTWRALGPLLTEPQPQPEPAVINSEVVGKLPADRLDGPPVVTCGAWAIADGETGQLLAGHQEDEPRDPASTTKIMTALVVVRLADEEPNILDEVVTVSQRADDTPGSTAGIEAGEQLAVGELLYGLLLPSGNDAAVALAEHFGDRLGDKDAGDDQPADAYDRFIAAMNRTAAELGMAATHFENPHGLTGQEHVTSARDLARLGAAAMGHHEIRIRVATPQRGTTVDSVTGYRRNVVWRSTNQLLRREGFDGVKTGTTGRAGCCLVSSGHRDGRRLIVVVLGSVATESRYADTRNLYRWAWRELIGSERDVPSIEQVNVE